MIVVPHPLGSEVSDFIEVLPVILAQPFVAHGSVKALNISVLLWLTRLDVLEGNTGLFCPSLDCGTDIFWTVVAPNDVGSSAPLNDLF